MKKGLIFKFYFYNIKTRLWIWMRIFENKRKNSPEWGYFKSWKICRPIRFFFLPFLKGD